MLLKKIIVVLFSKLTRIEKVVAVAEEGGRMPCFNLLVSSHQVDTWDMRLVSEFNIMVDRSYRSNERSSVNNFFVQATTAMAKSVSKIN